MSEIKALGASLTGSVSAKSALSGKLSSNRTLSGNISIMKEYDVYNGAYQVVPRAFDAQTLQTAEKLLKEDITVTDVPYWETSNESDGVSAYIAKELEYGN